jgi:hypothetical protein
MAVTLPRQATTDIHPWEELMIKFTMTSLFLLTLLTAICLSGSVTAEQRADYGTRPRVSVESGAPPEVAGERGCTWLSYYCNAAYANALPDPGGYGDDFYNQKFTCDSLCTLKTVELGFYDGSSTGDPGAEVYIWQSDGTFPTSVITTVTIGTVTNWFPSFESLDLYAATIILTGDFHVGYSPIRYDDADTLAILSDDGTCGANRASGFWNGSWHSWNDLFGSDENLLINAEVCCREAYTGAHCSNPLTLAIGPSDLPLTLPYQSTCGLGYYYDLTCLGDYDGGADMVIELLVTDSMNVDITLDPKGTPMTGFCIDDACPPGQSCIRGSASIDGDPYCLPNLNLEPGTYYIIVDSKASQGCIPDFDLTISEKVGEFVGDFFLGNAITECGTFNGTGVFGFGFDTELTSGVSYLNICVDFDDNGDCDSSEWVIRNVPLANISLHRYSHDVFFDLSGLMRGPFDIYGAVTPGGLTGIPTLSNEYFEEVVPDQPPVDDTLMACDLDYIPQPPPEGDPMELEDSEPMGRTDMPDIPQDINECVPTATANSLIWLAKKNGWVNDLLTAIGQPPDGVFDQSSSIYHDSVTWDEESLIEALKYYMYPSHAGDEYYPGTPMDSFFLGKERFAAEHGLDVETHGAPADGNAYGTGVFAFIRDELEADQDVEITYTWPGCECGHMVTAIDIAIDGNTAYVYLVDSGDNRGTSEKAHIRVFEGEVSSGKFVNPDTYPCWATAESPRKEDPVEWGYHPTLKDGLLCVSGTKNFGEYTLPLFDTGYVYVCTTYESYLPLWITNILVEYDWGRSLGSTDQLDVVLPSFNSGDSTWHLLKLEEFLYPQLAVGERLLMPSLGDTSGTVPDLYVVVDIGQWMTGSPLNRSSYSIVDGQCPDLPGYLIGTTPIVFNSDAPYWGSPFETTPLTGTLISDGEVSVGRGEEYVCGDADGNGIVNISDAVFLIGYIFGGGAAPEPLLSGDADCNEIVNISDAVYLIAYIFGGGAVPCAACP